MLSGDPFASSWLELHQLDRILAQLTRPALPEAGLPAAVSARLRGIGVASGPHARRDLLVEHVWDRKRPLLRHLQEFDEPLPPCA